jgi:alkanesulfonate monooxygenase SsuD/methylene tetrahydromethanopterin reductase-like flavin-dependent oxidoreductase (luciferase family)
VDLYRRALTEFGRDPLPIAVHSPGFVAPTDKEAADILWPHTRRLMNRIGRERGWPPMSRDRFEADITDGAQHVGSPETVARKITRTIRTLGIQRFDLKYSAGTLPHEQMMRSIELYATEVVPRVRELLAEQGRTP